MQSAAPNKKRRGPVDRARPTRPIHIIALGLTAGFVMALVLGVYVIYADMMSRVTYADPEAPPPMHLRNLVEDEFDQEIDPELQALLEQWMEFNGDSEFDDPESEEPSELDESTPSQTTVPRQAVSVQMAQMPGVDNIVLFGVDTHSYRGRSDVIILLSINHNTKTINMVSLMRAMYVRIGLKNHEWGHLNAAYSYGGPSLAVKTIERNFGIPIKGFVAVNFTSFLRIVQALGGVNITLSAREAEVLGLEAGAQRLSASKALAYSRIRKIDSDFQRNQRQRNVINSIMSEMAAQGGASVYKVAAVVLANTYTNLDLNSYMAKAATYLSYGRRQLQLPAMSETRRYYVGKQEAWWFDMVKTHKRLVNFLSN